MTQRNLTRAVFFGAVLALASTACSESGNSVSPDGGPSSDAGADRDVQAIVDACGEFAAAACARSSECDPVSWYSQGACEYDQAAQCRSFVLVDGNLETAETINECAAALASVTCPELRAQLLPDSCSPPGARVSGEACSNSSACASRRCSRGSSSCGICVDQVAVGEECSPLANSGHGEREFFVGDCSDGAYCDFFTNWTCLRIGEVGDFCDEFFMPFACQPGLACIQGQCAEPLEADAECTFDGWSQPCASGLHCDIDSETCVPQATEGQPCDPEDFYGCASPAYCSDESLECEDRTFVGAGEECAAEGPYCNEAGACSSEEAGVCEARGREGELCHSDLPCLGGAICAEGVCRTPPVPVCE